VRSVIAEVNPDLGVSAQQPVDVLAHSLGGAITFDTATADQPLWIRQFVTFGSQPSLFHVCDPRRSINALCRRTDS
jgi:surfactin synthase thioesterase subunit